MRGGKSDKNDVKALLGAAGSWSQRIEGGGALEDFFEDRGATDGMTQMRGVEAEGADK